MRLGPWECEIGYTRHVEDMYIERAMGHRTGVELTESQLNELAQDYAAELYEAWFEWHIDAAEDLEPFDFNEDLADERGY
jgi:hypothetical protein